MENTNPNETSDEQFSDDPKENLRIENEILHLKLKAELGGELVNDPELPPELENEFLKNILAFEHAYANVKQVKVYDMISNPPFTKSSELDDEQIAIALQNITALLEEKDIVVDFNGSYSDRVKYTFITEELFEHETDDMHMPGMTKHFSYEEFHQNHQLDLETRTEEFMSDWFEHRMNEHSWEMGDPFILPNGTILKKDALLAKIQLVFDAYTAFTDCSYKVDSIHFEVDDVSGEGLGNTEGTVQYKAFLESGEQIEIEGPFKLYLSLQDKWWTIFYFVFPGFEW